MPASRKAHCTRSSSTRTPLSRLQPLPAALPHITNQRARPASTAQSVDIVPWLYSTRSVHTSMRHFHQSPPQSTLHRAAAARASPCQTSMGSRPSPQHVVGLLPPCAPLPCSPSPHCMTPPLGRPRTPSPSPRCCGYPRVPVPAPPRMWSYYILEDAIYICSRCR